MTLRPDKQRVLKSLAAVAARTHRTPSRRKFLATSGISESTVSRFFPTWNAAVRAARLKPNIQNQRLDDRKLLADWGRVARKNHKIPSRRVYGHFGTFDHRTLTRRFGRWSQVGEAFRSFAQGKPEWADVVVLLRPAPQKPPASGAPVARVLRKRRTESGSRAAALHAAAPAKIRHQRLRGRPIYGGPMVFEGFRHEPVNEQGVVLLFGMVAQELGYVVESVQSGFPDCEAKRQIAPDRWQRVHLEFEFESRNYREHGHPAAGCDVIVCWRHNWPDHPPQLEILELRTVVKTLLTFNNAQ